MVEQTPAALILLRSPVVDLLDFAERMMPMLTPETLVDERPLMKGRGQRAEGSGTTGDSVSLTTDHLSATRGPTRVDRRVPQ